ncbi:MAG: hypothetical protein ACJ8FY_22865 [Gemmataceae bacterium]
MTRETKVGLVVSCSFLCLVGVVLTNKLKELSQKQTAAEEDQVVVPEQVAQAPTGPNDPFAGVVMPASAEEIKNLDPAPDSTGDPLAGVDSHPSLNQEKTRIKPDLPPTEVEDFSQARPRVAAKDDRKDTDIKNDTSQDDAKKLPPGNDDLPPPDLDEKTDKTQKEADDPGKDKKQNNLNGLEDVPPPVVKPSKEKTAEDGLAKPNKKQIETEPTGERNAVTDLDGPPPAPRKDPRVTQPPAPVAPPVSIGQPLNKGAAKEALDGFEPGKPALSDRNTKPPVEVTIPERQPAVPPSLPNREPASASIKVATAPIKRIPVSSSPEVDSFDEEVYRCKAGDSFDKISQRYYQTDKYAQALEAFNRNHPQAGDAIRQQPGNLANGQRVYIPPIAILRKRHAAIITEDSREPNSNAADEKTSSSRPRTSLETQDNSIQAREYSVDNPNGETMREIAEKLLRDPNRWMEIARLNPGFQPLLPIPATARIKLPN